MQLSSFISVSLEILGQARTSNLRAQSHRALNYSTYTEIYPQIERSDHQLSYTSLPCRWQSWRFISTRSHFIL